jgi:hypothetical protein
MKPQLDPEAAPLEFHYRPDPFEVKGRLIVGLAVAVVAAAAALFISDDLFALVIACGFALLGLFVAAYGVLQSRFSLSVVFSSLEVAVERHSLWGAAKWHESVHRYQGVLLREEEIEERGSGKIRRVKRYGIVELVHEDPGKNVLLYVREGGEAPSEIQEAFARRFHLPELELGIDGKLAREKRKLSADPGPAPAGVKVEEADGVMCLSVEPGSLGRAIPWLFWPLLPVGAGLLVHQLEPGMALIAAGMAGAFALFQIGMGEVMARRSRGKLMGLCIGGRAVWVGRIEETPRTRVLFEELKQVRADRAKGQSGSSFRLVVEGGGKRLELSGGQFDRKKAEWIRDKVLHLADSLS